MTPESKALQLLERFSFNNTTNQDQAKQGALMCVYEIIDYLTNKEQDIYWEEVRMFLLYIGTDELEAKSDRFNLNA